LHQKAIASDKIATVQRLPCDTMMHDEHSSLRQQQSDSFTFSGDET